MLWPVCIFTWLFLFSSLFSNMASEYPQCWWGWWGWWCGWWWWWWWFLTMTTLCITSTTLDALQIVTHLIVTTTIWGTLLLFSCYKWASTERLSNLAGPHGSEEASLRFMWSLWHSRAHMSHPDASVAQTHFSTLSFSPLVFLPPVHAVTQPHGGIIQHLSVCPVFLWNLGFCTILETQPGDAWNTADLHLGFCSCHFL